MTVTQIIAIVNNKQGFLLFMERNERFPLFHCSYFIKQLPSCFPVYSGCGASFGKREKLAQAQATSHGNPFGISLIVHVKY